VGLAVMDGEHTGRCPGSERGAEVAGWATFPSLRQTQTLCVWGYFPGGAFQEAAGRVKR
jgi:hypothetical protein